MLATGIAGVPWLQPDQETKLEQPQGQDAEHEAACQCVRSKDPQKDDAGSALRCSDNRHQPTFFYIVTEPSPRELCGALLQASLMQGGQFCRW